jgi:carbonic anhydrase/acetyltransferase-like protein (isoleucine patch superfamily)
VFTKPLQITNVGGIFIDASGVGVVMLFSLDGVKVKLCGEGHYIAPNATLIGNVVLHEQVSIWFNVVIRADADKVTIGPGSNIQDGAILHVDPGFPLALGAKVSVGHKAMLHGCSIGDGSLIGINAVVLNGAIIGKNCLIGANALVTEGMVVPDNSMVLGSPGKIVRQLGPDQAKGLSAVADHYVDNALRYNGSLKEQGSAWD